VPFVRDSIAPAEGPRRQDDSAADDDEARPPKQGRDRYGCGTIEQNVPMLADAQALVGSCHAMIRKKAEIELEPRIDESKRGYIASYANEMLTIRAWCTQRLCNHGPMAKWKLRSPSSSWSNGRCTGALSSIPSGWADWRANKNKHDHRICVRADLGRLFTPEHHGLGADLACIRPVAPALSSMQVPRIAIITASFGTRRNFSWTAASPSIERHERWSDDTSDRQAILQSHSARVTPTFASLKHRDKREANPGCRAYRRRCLPRRRVRSRRRKHGSQQKGRCARSARLSGS